MSTIIEKEADSTWQFRVTGMLKKSELDEAQAGAREEIARGGQIKVLLLLEEFQGWEPGADWADMEFAYTHGNQIEKIAIVADPKWETEALMFVGAGFRRTKVQFFPSADLARARTWLAEPTR
jgi:hypothetical protein